MSPLYYHSYPLSSSLETIWSSWWSDSRCQCQSLTVSPDHPCIKHSSTYFSFSKERGVYPTVEGWKDDYPNMFETLAFHWAHCVTAVNRYLPVSKPFGALEAIQAANVNIWQILQIIQVLFSPLVCSHQVRDGLFFLRFFSILSQKIIDSQIHLAKQNSKILFFIFLEPSPNLFHLIKPVFLFFHTKLLIIQTSSKLFQKFKVFFLKGERLAFQMVYISILYKLIY